MTQKAVTETIRICKDRNVLKEYLLEREKEVVTIMMSLFDDVLSRGTFFFYEYPKRRGQAKACHSP